MEILEIISTMVMPFFYGILFIAATFFIFIVFVIMGVRERHQSHKKDKKEKKF